MYKDKETIYIKAISPVYAGNGQLLSNVGYGYFEEITKDKCLRQGIDNSKILEKEVEELKEQKKLDNMTESEKKLYILEKNCDSKERSEKLKKLFANREKEKLEQREIIRLAKLIKEDIEDDGKWKYSLGRKGKKNKLIKRIEKICEILNIDLPIKNNPSRFIENEHNIMNPLFVGMKIKKPRKETEVIKIDEEGFFYRIGKKNKKKVIYEEIQEAIKEIKEKGKLTRQWYKNKFPKISKSRPCNFTTIGGLLVKFQLAKYENNKYKYKNK